MKTNQLLNSSDRELFGITIKQNTKDQMLSLTDLQKAYEKARWIHGWSERGINTIMQSKEFKERLYHILNEQDTIKVGIPTFMEMTDKEGVAKVLKGLGVYKTQGRGANKTVMANPYVWVLLALELNPMIYAKVIIWLTDSLIFNRLEAGSNYLPMNIAIDKIIANAEYFKYAILINQKVFGRHIAGIRNLASAKELRNISNIESYIINLIESKFISNEEQLILAINSYKLNN